MVRHRWTIALITICIPILVTVSAFRVRLAHERTDSQKHCDTCDVNELNLGQKHSKSSGKLMYDGLKKVVHEKKTVSGSKLSADDLTYLHGLSGDEKFHYKTKLQINDKNDDDSHLILEKPDKRRSKIKVDNVKTVINIKQNFLSDDDDEDDNGINVEDSDSDAEVVDDNNGNEDDEKDEIDDSDEHDGKVLVVKANVPLKAALKHEKVTPEKILPKSVRLDQSKESIAEEVKIRFSKKLTPEPSVEDANEIKRDLSKKSKADEVINESVILQTINKAQKKVSEVTSKDEKLKKDLEKIKVKSHIEAGKIQTHIISKNEDDLKLKKEDKIKVEKGIKKHSLQQETLKNVKIKTKTRDIQIKPLTDASQRKILLQSEFEDFYGFFPTFAPNFSRVHNPECRRHGQILLRQLRGTKLWALNMLDATAKIPSGLLHGNGIQLGDFDQCLGSRARVQLETGSVVKIQGKYCLASMDVKAEHPELEVPVDLLQGRNLIKGRVNDPGHFVPRFSTLSWGLCVPSPCNPNDVELMIKDAIKHYQKLGISFTVEIDELDCHVQKKGNWWDEWMEVPTLLTLCFYTIVLCLVIIATCQDMLGERNGQVENSSGTDGNKEDDNNSKKSSDGFISAFSLSRTMKKLVAPAGADEIPSIHGLRAAATIALIAAHKFLPVAHMPYSNRIKVAEVVSSPLWSWCRVGWIFTDCFLLLSGTLTAYRTSDKTSAFNKLASKYLRLTPALLAVIWFYAYIWDHITVGPMWGSLVTKNADICRDGWWWNMFYVQNYFGLENMCAPQTHQLALDMQLSFVGSFIVWAIQSDIVGSRLAMPVIHLYAAYSRYTTFKNHRLTMIAYHGVSVSQLYRTGRMSYTSILHRSTSYLIGISLGLALRSPALHSKLLIFLGWVVSTGLWGAVLWAGFDSGFLNYQYNVTFAAQYAALAPIATALAFAWLLYAAHNGCSEILSSFLCSRPLLIISRLSYALYLTQFVVFLTNAATIKTSTQFSILSVIDFQEISAILLSAIVLTLTFVIPMQSLPNVIFREKRNENVTDKTETDEDTNVADNIELPIKIEEKPVIRKPLLAHREFLEEIPETEMEYGRQRDRQSFDEILEEEDDNLEEDQIEDEDLEIIEEEEGGEEDFWAEEVNPEIRDRDIDEWEWSNGNRGGAQFYRYSR